MNAAVKNESTSIRMSASMYASVKRERNRIYAETGSEASIASLIEAAWRLYMEYRDYEFSGPNQPLDHKKPTKS